MALQTKIECALSAGYEPRELPTLLRCTRSDVNAYLDSVRRVIRANALASGRQTLDPIWPNI